ncbi:MAG: SDR family NAD(P)-dependent oxidoreductase [Porphyromonadaceae bacterium]|nr:SDR family NAD(P)-dependent oxidoreductase [Porphyromonadaceae bacterium]
MANKRVIIMGASSGIGLELAKLYIARGYQVGLAARRLEPLLQLQKLAPERIIIESIDLTDEGCTRLLDRLIEELGGLDLYLHSSGIGWQNIGLNEELEQQTNEVNVFGFTRAVGHIFNLFAAQGDGHIAAISSVAGTRGLGSAAAYSSSKAYQATYLQALRQLCAIRGLSNVRITDIRPGFVATPLLSGAHFPMIMTAPTVARAIVRAIDKGKSIRIIDWRYRLLVGLWRLIPRPLWERLPIK